MANPTSTSTDAGKYVQALTPEVLSALEANAASIQSAAQALGISALAIAAPIACEMNKVDVGDYDPSIVGPGIAGGALYSALHALANEVAVYGAVNLANASAYGLPLAPLTNQDYVESQQAALAAGASNVQSARQAANIARIDYPTLNDIGFGKIQIGTAMNALAYYESQVAAGTITGDPLNLNQYVNNTPQLVQDLINPATSMQTSISIS
jgi:hypothetical protein